MSQLDIYNGAAMQLGERFITSLSDDVPLRYILDYVWNNGGIRYCLEKGHWNFSMRTQEIEASESVEPDFSFSYAYEKPSDWVKTTAFSADEYFQHMITDYVDERDYWFSNYQKIYVKYVSDDPAYGMDYSLWTESFKEFVHLHFAYNAMERVSASDSKKQSLERRYKEAMRSAKGNDAHNQPMDALPAGSWNHTRMGGGYYASRNNYII